MINGRKLPPSITVDQGEKVNKYYMRRHNLPLIDIMKHYLKENCETIEEALFEVLKDASLSTMGQFLKDTTIGWGELWEGSKIDVTFHSSQFWWESYELGIQTLTLRVVERSTLETGSTNE